VESPQNALEQDAGSNEEYRFILPTFQGPLDLLLHLIRSNELEIMDLPVAEVARQYDDMLSLMEELNLEVAGEFLVMAATLIYIKSKLLLPVDKERIEQGLEEDPRKNLVQALLEHERFQQVAEDLADRESMASLVFTREGDTEPDEKGYLEVGLFDLLDAFKKLLAAADKRQALNRHVDRLPLADRIAQILVLMENHERLGFSRLLPADADINLLVVTFLAMLELIKNGRLRAVQAHPLAEIQLRRVRADE